MQWLGGPGLGGDISFRTWVAPATEGPALAVGAGSVNVNTLLHLSPRNTPPPVAEAGDVYFDANMHKLRYFDGTPWVSL